MSNPNSVPPKNGVKFKKGNKANPLGAGAHDPLKREFKKLTQEELESVGNLLLFGNKEDLVKIQHDKNTTVFKAWVASVIIKAINRGDMGALNSILDRFIGKVKSNLHVTGVPSSVPTGELSAEQEIEFRAHIDARIKKMALLDNEQP